jgi:hypothetical protein
MRKPMPFCSTGRSRHYVTALRGCKSGGRVALPARDGVHRREPPRTCGRFAQDLGHMDEASRRQREIRVTFRLILALAFAAGTL